MAIRSKGINFRFLEVFDPSEHPVLSAYVMNSWTPKETSLKYERHVQRVVESGFGDKFLEECGKSAAVIFGQMMGITQDTSDVESYVSQRILPPDTELIQPSVEYFMQLFVSVIVLWRFFVYRSTC